MWFWEMINLNSNGTGTKTDTDSEIWLRSSRNSKRGVEIGSKIGSKPKINVHTLSPSMKCEHKILAIQFHSVLVQDSIVGPKAFHSKFWWWLTHVVIVLMILCLISLRFVIKFLVGV